MVVGVVYCGSTVVLSLNRSKKPLWNLRAGWAVLLAFMAGGSLAIYSYYNFNSPDKAEKAITGIAGSFCSTIFFFYGTLTGLTYLRRARSRALWILAGPVSYTHLTLPTICSV